MRALIHGILALNFALFMAAPTFAQDAAARQAVGADMTPELLVSTVVQPLATKAKVDCTVTQARIMGASADQDIYEAACAGGVGVVLSAISPQTADSAVTFVSCLNLKNLTDAITCSLSTDETNMAVFANLPAAANQPCTVAGSRFVGEVASSQTMFVEYQCSEGPGAGYIAGADFKGTFKRVVPCLQAEGLGGCKLSDVSALLANQNGTFSTLARAKGFDCEVKAVSAFPPKANSTDHASEIQCANRAESAVVVQKEDGASEVMNCVRSRVEGYSCSFSPVAAAYPLLTKDLATAGRGTDCAVNNARVVGRSSRYSFVEVTCSDGAQGFMLQYPIGIAAPEAAIVCSQATDLGGGCTMPANVKEGA